MERYLSPTSESSTQKSPHTDFKNFFKKLRILELAKETTFSSFVFKKEKHAFIFWLVHVKTFKWIETERWARQSKLRCKEAFYREYEQLTYVEELDFYILNDAIFSLNEKACGLVKGLVYFRKAGWKVVS